MFENLDIFRLTSGLARHSTARQELVAKNVANADTPGYRARDTVTFSDAFQASEGAAQLRATRTGHVTNTGAHSPLLETTDSPDPSSPNGNTVSLETEMMKAAQTRHQHELALSVYKSSMSILRASIGKR
ncbi:FlgB family protein [Celeribacter marinus]|uniref:Flagellar basal body rod protein FlgB n=1 Tax=Celeribacter marinus TaxID=1397108 RepID=A0A0P0AC47_9RHOB|nr:FlgB family protein [Celeribacter marinus]ALI55659.1 flagellar basal-body rod protein FlgB [Celeribacter marinus]SFK25454.1 flagellar basal-body rod protein FlgB [Celeribacter marinus]